AELDHLEESTKKSLHSMRENWLEKRQHNPFLDTMPNQNFYGMKVWEEYKKKNLWANSIEYLEELLSNYFALTYCKIMSTSKMQHFISFAGDAKMTSEKFSFIHEKLSELGIKSRLVSA